MRKALLAASLAAGCLMAQPSRAQIRSQTRLIFCSRRKTIS
jgi:hypothetical protein